MHDNFDDLNIEELIGEKSRLLSIAGEDRSNVLYEEFALVPEEVIAETGKLKEEIERLRELVYKDELTKVYNRRGFFEILNPIFKDAYFHKKNTEKEKRSKWDDVAIIFVDLDDFKSVNDNYGHDEGDDVLKSFANVAKDVARETDIVARFGGEEFVIALLGADENIAYKKAEELRSEVLNKIRISSDSNRKITGSIGVASLKEASADTLDELVGYADKAMYEAKQNRGKNNTVRWSEISDKN